MKALTIWQPWAQLIARGHKRLETRDNGTAYRGPLAIHAGSRMDPEQQALLWHDPYNAALGYAHWTQLPLGVVVATAVLVDCYQLLDKRHRPKEPERTFGDYRLGRWVYVLEDVKRVLRPVAMRGQPNLWDTPFELDAPLAVVERDWSRAG